MLKIPADPRWQRTVLSVLLDPGVVAPGGVAAFALHHARLKVNPEPLPKQQEDGRARRWTARAPTGQQTFRCKKKRKKAGFEKHAVRLIAGEILRGCYEREETQEAEDERSARPEIGG